MSQLILKTTLATGAGSLPSSQAGVQRATQAEQLQGEDLETKQQADDVLMIACVSFSKTVAADDEDKVACIHFKQLKYVCGIATLFSAAADASDKVTFLAIFLKLTQSLLHRLRSPMRILPKRGSFQFVERARSLSGSSLSALSPKTE